jgi:hypothetical protein
MVCVATDSEGDKVYVILKDDGSLDVQPQVGQHIPPDNLDWVLPNADAVLAHYEKLTAANDPSAWLGVVLEDVEAWINSASDLGRPEAILMCALYVMLTYAIEHTDYLPILLLEAEPERGKSRAGCAMIYVSRHGIWLQGVREANLIRDARDRQASLFIDLMDLWGKMEKANCEDILLGRWERGGAVKRVTRPDAGPHADTETFPVFGPTILATNEPVDRILDTRCLRIDMPLTERRFSGRVRPEEAKPLLAALMAWRAWVLAHGLPAMESPADHRLGDVLRPLKQVLKAVDPERLAEFDAIVSWQQGRRGEDLSQSTEAAIVKAVASCTPVDGYLSLKDVLNAFNRELPEDYKPRHARWLGDKIRGIGFHVDGTNHKVGTRVIHDPATLKRMKEKYGILRPVFGEERTA